MSIGTARLLCTIIWIEGRGMFSEEAAKRRVILRPLSNNGSRKKLGNRSVGICLQIASEGKSAVSKDIGEWGR